MATLFRLERDPIKGFVDQNIQTGKVMGNPKIITSNNLKNIKNNQIPLEHLVKNKPGFEALTTGELRKSYDEQEAITLGYQHLEATNNALQIINNQLYNFNEDLINENPEVLYGIINFQQDMSLYIPSEMHIQDSSFENLKLPLKKRVLENIAKTANELNEIHSLDINSFTISEIEKVIGYDKPLKNNLDKTHSTERDPTAIITYTTGFYKSN